MVQTAGKINTGRAKVRKRGFFGVTKMSGKPVSKKLKILFSIQEEWEPSIRKDFRYTHHELIFGGFSDVNQGQYDLLVPLSIPDLEYLNRNGHLIKNNAIPIPSQKSMDLCNDKYLFHQTLVEMALEDIYQK